MTSPLPSPLIRSLSVTLIAALVVLAGAGFGPLAALWLAALAVLTWLSPACGTGLLFFAISMDPARQFFGRIFVSLSELETGICLLALLAPKGLTRIDWRPAGRGIPYFGAVLLSGLVNIEAYKALPHAVRPTEMLLALFLASNALTAENGRRVFAWFIGAAGVFYSAAGFLQYRHLTVSPFDVTGGDKGRIYSFFANPNQFAGYLALLLPFALVFAFKERGLRRIAWGYIALVVSLAELATLSRAAWLGTLFSSLVMYLLARRPWRTALCGARPGERAPRRRIALSIAALTPGLLLVGLLALAHTRVATEVANSVENLKARSLPRADGMLHESRPDMFRFGWSVWKENFLFGIGPGQYAARVDRDPETLRSYGGDPALRAHVHSLYLQLGVDYGLLGLLAFLYFAGGVAAVLLTRRRSVWTLAGLGLLAAFLAGNLFDVTFPSLGLETGLLVGAACARDGKGEVVFRLP